MVEPPSSPLLQKEVSNWASASFGRRPKRKTIETVMYRAILLLTFSGWLTDPFKGLSMAKWHPTRESKGQFESHGKCCFSRVYVSLTSTKKNTGRILNLSLGVTGCPWIRSFFGVCIGVPKAIGLFLHTSNYRMDLINNNFVKCHEILLNQRRNP